MKNKNIKSSIKQFMNSKVLLYFVLPLLLGITLLIPMDYYITIGGGTFNLDKDIKVEEEQDKKGSINAAYVSEVRANVITYLMSYIIPTFEREKIEDVTLENEEKADYEFREKLYFTSSINNAVINAYSNANKKITIKNSDLYVLYKDSFSESQLEVQDKIISIDNKEVKDVEEFTNIIKSYNENDIINIKVLRDEKEVNTKTKIKIIDNEKRIGIYMLNDYNYDVEPSIDFSFNNKQSGPSGGLMLSLSIYNKLMDYDITKGYKICGTGTIDKDGIVGEIGGLKYKLKGANRKRCDVFFVPIENYQEAKEILKNKNYKVKLYKVGTFKEAINILNNL